jgi:hypothetical protein
MTGVIGRTHDSGTGANDQQNRHCFNKILTTKKTVTYPWYHFGTLRGAAEAGVAIESDHLKTVSEWHAPQTAVRNSPGRKREIVLSGISRGPWQL